MEWEQRQNRGVQQKYPWLTQVLSAWELTPTYAAIEGSLCRVKCHQGKWWVLKRMEERDRAEFIGALLTQLSQYQLTPPAIRTKYGDNVAYWLDGYYYLMPLIRGKEGANHKLSDVSLAAQRLALFHRYARRLSLPRFQGDDFPALSSRLQQYQEVCHPDIDKIDHTQTRLEAADFLYRAQSRLANFPRYQLAELERQAIEGETVRHGHFHCGQVMKEHRSAFIVHWEEASMGVQLLDLSDFCYKVLTKNKWQPEYYLAILNGYQDILPLSDSEKSFLEQTLLLPIELERGLASKKSEKIKGKQLEKIFTDAIEAENRKLNCLAAAKGEPLPRSKGKKEEKAVNDKKDPKETKKTKKEKKATKKQKEKQPTPAKKPAEPQKDKTPNKPTNKQSETKQPKNN